MADEANLGALQYQDLSFSPSDLTRLEQPTASVPVIDGYDPFDPEQHKPTPSILDYQLSEKDIRAIQTPERFIGKTVRDFINFIKTPGKAFTEGVKEEEALQFGVEGALATIGTGARFPISKGVTVPVVTDTAKLMQENAGFIERLKQYAPKSKIPKPTETGLEEELKALLAKDVATATKPPTSVKSELPFELKTVAYDKYGIVSAGGEPLGDVYKTQLAKGQIKTPTELKQYYLKSNDVTAYKISDKAITDKVPSGIQVDPNKIYDFHEPTLKHKPTYTDLPVEQSKRIERAKQLEYNIDETGEIGGDWYHGSNYDLLEGFNIAKAKSEPAMFLSRDPEISAIYGSNIYPVWTRAKNIEVIDLKEGTYSHLEFSKKINKARTEGKDAVLFKNVRDLGGLQDQLAVLKENIVRSKFAMFDPLLKHSASLTAGIAGTAIVLRRPVKEKEQ